MSDLFAVAAGAVPLLPAACHHSAGQRLQPRRLPPEHALLAGPARRDLRPRHPRAGLLGGTQSHAVTPGGAERAQHNYTHDGRPR